MSVRGVRGATTVTENTETAILKATQVLLSKMLMENGEMQISDIGSAWFTVTADLDAAFPAKAARQLGWQFVPMLCTQEIPVPGSLPKCIRVLLHWNTEKEQNEINHIYLNEAVRLRPDLTK